MSCITEVRSCLTEFILPVNFVVRAGGVLFQLANKAYNTMTGRDRKVIVFGIVLSKLKTVPC